MHYLWVYILEEEGLKPFFKMASFIVPFTSVMIIESIHFSMTPLIQLSFSFVGYWHDANEGMFIAIYHSTYNK